MTNRDRSNETAVSLMPMFNILICTLGVLIFILGAVVAISLGVGKSVVIIPESIDSTEVSKTPIFIEWNGSELIPHPGADTIRFARELKEITTWTETYDYMDSCLAMTPTAHWLRGVCHDSSSQYLVILIRPSGFHNFKEIRGYIEKRLGIDLGYEPIDQNWVINVDGDYYVDAAENFVSRNQSQSGTADRYPDLYCGIDAHHRAVRGH